MGLFGNLSTDGLEKTQDTLGGYVVHESDAYLATIKVAYLVEAASGAKGIALQIDMGGKEYNETVYITNKAGENFFLNQQDKTKKIPLPGFTLINDLCIVTTEKPLSEQDADEKMVNIYDPVEKKAVPRGAQVLINLVGKTAYFGILKRLENKTKKNDQTGVYEPTDETREVNALVKVFHDPTKLTVNEVMQAQANGKMPEEPEFFEAWIKKNKGVTQDTTKKRGGGAKSGAPGGGGSNAPKTNSLFGNK